MAKTSKSCWTAFERWIASFWGTKRTPLSGENSGHGGGDIILTGYDALVEAKLRSKFIHHTLFRAAQADAKKHKINPLHTFLYTKLKHERGAIVLMDAEFFHSEVLPSLQPRLKKEAQQNEPTTAENTGGDLRDPGNPDTRVYTETSPKVQLPEILDDSHVEALNEKISKAVLSGRKRRSKLV